MENLMARIIVWTHRQMDRWIVRRRLRQIERALRAND